MMIYFTSFVFHVRRVIVAGLFASVIALSAGCASDPTDVSADSLGQFADFSNGWYHWASGSQSVREIASIYLRDPALTAELNRTRPEAIPAENTAIYIPPVHDRATLRQILAEINANPAAVRTAPPSVDEFRTADQMLAMLQQPQEVAEPESIMVEPTPVASPEPTITQTPAPSPVVAAPVEPQPSSSQPEVTQSAQPTQTWSNPSTASTTATDPAAIPLQAAPVPTKVFSLEEAQKRYDAELEASRVMKAQAGRFNWPVQGKIIRPFSTTGADPFPGIAIEAPEGAPIFASREGKVVFAGVLEGYGNVVIIEHTSRETSVYGYASQILVKVNRQVVAGEQIALVGRPSASSPSQVYFQIRKNARPMNPLQVLP